MVGVLDLSLGFVLEIRKDGASDHEKLLREILIRERWESTSRLQITKENQPRGQTKNINKEFWLVKWTPLLS